MLELPLTGKPDVLLLNLQGFDEPDKNYKAEWANTVLEISYVEPPEPPQLDAEVGVISGSLSSFDIDTLASDFDTELGI